MVKKEKEELTPDEKKILKELRGKNINKKHLDILLKEIKHPTNGPVKVFKHPVAEGKTVKYGVYGDRHVGSKFYDNDAVWRFADEAAKWGVEFMLDPGDSVDGSMNMHRGMWREQDELGFDAQLDKLLETTPDLGCPLYHVNGNHDYTWLKSEGANLGEHYARNDPDVIHLGTSSAILEVGKTKIQLLHPGGGSSYALSYKPQKIIESLPGGEKPHILHINHFHKMCQLFYRNVHCFMDGTFQSQTHWMMEKGLAAHKGGWLIEYESDKDGGIVGMQTKFVPFYK